jgi:DNA-binding transcriptional ArsR family regulator
MSYQIGDIVPTPWGGKIEIVAHEDDFYIGKDGFAWGPFTDDDGGQYLTAYKGNSPAVDKYFKKPEPNKVLDSRPWEGLPPEIAERAKSIITADDIIAADESMLIQSTNGNGPQDDGFQSSFTPMLMSNLLGKQFKPQEFLIEGLLAKGNLAILGGRPKSGKSFLGLQAAMCIDTGAAFLGRETLKSKVLYYALEDGQRRVQSRARLINWQPNQAAVLFKIANLDDGAGGPGPGINEIWEHFIKEGFDLVIIDTLIAAMSGRTDERDNSSMGAIINALAGVAHSADKAILILHHTGKSINPDDIFSTLRGASAIRGGYDVGLILERKPGEREAILHTESRDFDIRNMTLRQAENGAGWDFIGDAYEIERIRAGRKVLEAMIENDADDKGMTAKQLADIRKVSDVTVHNQLKRLEEAGYIYRDEQPSTQMGKKADIWHVKEAYR